MQELDADRDGKITFQELKEGVRRWLIEMKRQEAESKGGARRKLPWHTKVGGCGLGRP